VTAAAGSGAGLSRRGGADTIIDLGAAELTSTAADLLATDHRLALVAAHDDGDQLRVVYLFTGGPPDRRVELHVRTGTRRPSVPSLASLSFPGSRFEREMHDLFGIEPVGHPFRRRLVRHRGWPEGWHPMRAGAGAPPAVVTQAAPFPFAQIRGAGVYEIPVGPVHAGLIEPGHFRFWVVGETILKMKARLWFLHKGMERLFQGRTPMEGIELAERISGDTAVGHGIAYCLALESAIGTVVPDRAQELRAILLEMERLYNHVADIGALCNDAGFGLAQARALILRERLLRLNDAITGHRLLRGGTVLGGAQVRRLPTGPELTEIGERAAALVDLARSHPVVMDRFSGTAVLTAPQARDIGVLGVVARACGLELDARVAHPFVAGGPTIRPACRTTGDVLARFDVRAEEVAASLTLLRCLVDGGGPLASTAPGAASGPPTGHGTGIVEGWRGSIVHRVELNRHGRLSRVKVVDPSFLNWPALSVALADTIVPDFPLANKSFSLSYAGNDL